MTYSTLLQIKNDAIILEYLIGTTELIASSEKGYKEFKDDKGQVYRATDYDPRLKKRVQVPIRGEAVRDGYRATKQAASEGIDNLKESAQKVASESAKIGQNAATALGKNAGTIGGGLRGMANALEKNTEYKNAMIQAAFGKGCIDIINDVLGATGEVAEKARQIATASYKKIEPNLEKITGHQVEQKIQDALIHLQVLQKRSLAEEIASVRSPQEAVKVVQNHQAEVVAATATIAGATAMAFGPQFLIALMFAAGDLATVDIGAIALDTMITTISSEFVGAYTEAIARLFTKDKKILGEIHAVASILAALSVGSSLYKFANVGKAAKAASKEAEAARKVAAEASEKAQSAAQKVAEEFYQQGTKIEDFSQLKQVFRKRAMEYHPDRLAAKLGRPPTQEEILHAEEAMKALNNAFEKIKKVKGL